HRRAPERRPRALQGKLWDLMAESRLTVSEYLEVPYVISRTDYLGVLPRSMAQVAEREFRMIVMDVPGPPIRIPIWLVWHEARRRDAGHAWLRGLVAREMVQAAADQGLVPPPLAAAAQ
ncbi:MAG: LysR substrate-binding domain-containing protein, partial [Elioraea tepidiphila]